MNNFTSVPKICKQFTEEHTYKTNKCIRRCLLSWVVIIRKMQIRASKTYWHTLIGPKLAPTIPNTSEGVD